MYKYNAHLCFNVVLLLVCCYIRPVEHQNITFYTHTHAFIPNCYICVISGQPSFWLWRCISVPVRRHHLRVYLFLFLSLYVNTPYPYHFVFISSIRSYTHSNNSRWVRTRIAFSTIRPHKLTMCNINIVVNRSLPFIPIVFRNNRVTLSFTLGHSSSIGQSLSKNTPPQHIKEHVNEYQPMYRRTQRSVKQTALLTHSQVVKPSIRLGM